MKIDLASLENFFAVQDENLAITRKNQPPFYDRLFKIDRLFVKVAASLDRSPDVLSGLFLFRSHSAFRGACRLGLSAQVIECFPLLRVVVEAAVYGWAVSQDDEKANLWVRRHDSAEARRQSAHVFQIRSLLRELERIDRRSAEMARKLYEITIDYGGHPNERSILGVTRQTENEDEIAFTLQYLTNTPIVMAATVKTICQAGVVALSVLSNVWAQRWSIMGVADELQALGRDL